MILLVTAPAPTNGMSLSSYTTDVIHVYERTKRNGEPLIKTILVNPCEGSNILLEELQTRYGTEVVLPKPA